MVVVLLGWDFSEPQLKLDLHFLLAALETSIILAHPAATG